MSWLWDGRILPVVVTDSPEIAPDLAAALAAGGVRVAEVTLRTPRALDVLARMAARAPAGFTVGAGTVLDTHQVDAAADAGAAFVVSPGYDPDVLARGRELGLAVLPGIATASEVQRARRDGIRTLKLFPADRLGGVATIEAFAAVFPDTGFVPSGGVDGDTCGPYLACPAVTAVSGSWLAPRRELDAGDVSAVAARARIAVEIAERDKRR